MKVMIRKSGERYSAYVPKKDLEEPIVAIERPGLWGGSVTLANDWVLALPDLPEETRLPITVEAKLVSGR